MTRCADLLQSITDADLRRDAEWLLIERFGIARVELGDVSLSAAQAEQARLDLNRLAAGEPLAYVLGNQDFWTLRLKVTADTLIPRADTETLVEAVLNQYDHRPIAVVDLGTGSGAIALALKSERPEWQVSMTDASAAALAIAQENASTLKLDVDTALGSWFDALDSDQDEAPQKSFDVIISNPPYIAEDDEHLAALTHEPHSALVAPNQGLADLEHIVSHARSWLKASGRVYLEHGYDQGAAVRGLFDKYGYTAIKTLQDLAQNDRVTVGVWIEDAANQHG